MYLNRNKKKSAIDYNPRSNRAISLKSRVDLNSDPCHRARDGEGGVALLTLISGLDLWRYSR